jgi:L-ascorbate metabolism protein UlaG (beta-lactamase superfamily)
MGTNMKNDIALVANAGILIRQSGMSVLVDALHVAEMKPFSRTPDAVLNQVIQGEGMFEKIDLMLITHTHPDHYDAKSVHRFMENHPETMLVMPEDDTAYGERTVLISKPHEEHTVGRAHIICEKLAHDGEKYAKDVQYGYLIEIDGVVFSVFGDTTMDVGGIKRLIGDRQVDVAVVNFPFVSLRHRQKVLMEVIRPKRAVAVHFPFEEDDSENYIRTTLRAIERAGRQSSAPPDQTPLKEERKPDLPPVAALYIPLQRIDI